MNNISTLTNSIPSIIKSPWIKIIASTACLATAIALIHIAFHSIQFGEDWVEVLIDKNILWLFAGAGLAGGVGIFLLCKTISQVFFKQKKIQKNIALAAIVGLTAMACTILSAVYLRTLLQHCEFIHHKAGNSIYYVYFAKDIFLTQTAFLGLTIGTMFSVKLFCYLAEESCSTLHKALARRFKPIEMPKRYLPHETL